MPELRIVVDENVLLGEETFSTFGRVITLPGSAITREAVRDADVLIVRSVTRVGPELLDGSRVSFVGSATIGTDHIETDFLHQRGTAFAHAPGSNAESVVEYVLAALLYVARRTGSRLNGRTIGIVGAGNIGRRLAERLPAFGFEVMLNDPPLARRAERSGLRHDFRPLTEVLEKCDIITLHVPLIRGGEDPTLHLFGEVELHSMKPGSWLINTSRGPVVDNQALLEILKHPGAGPDVAVLDVWEGEPLPSLDLVRGSMLATPHIAGYSYDGKLAGTLMIARALAQHLGIPEPDDIAPGRAPFALRPPDAHLPEIDWLHALTRQMYDIVADDDRMRSLTAESDLGAGFRRLRRDYPVRRTFAAHWMAHWWIPPDRIRQVRDGLGLDISVRSTFFAASAAIDAPPHSR